VSADGKSIAFAGGESGTLIRDGNANIFKAPGLITALAFDEEGKTLAAGVTEKDQDLRGVIRFWDAASGKMSDTSLHHASGVLGLSYLPKTKLLASAGKDNLVRLWDPAAARQVGTHKGHYGWVAALAASNTGTLVTGSYDGTIKTWSALPPDFIAAHKGPAQAVLFTPDGKAVISGGKDGTVKFWDPATGQELLPALTGLGEITSLAYAAKASPAKLAVGTWTDKEGVFVRFWDVSWDAKDPKDRLKSKEAVKSHLKGVSCLAFSTDGKMLASGSADGTAILWDTNAGKRTKLEGDAGAVRCLAFGGDAVLITGGSDGMVRQWEVNRGEQIRPPLRVHGGSVNAVGYFLPIAGFVTAGDDNCTKFWVRTREDQEPKVIFSHRSHVKEITSLAFSPNRRFLATASADRTLRLFNSQMEDASATQFFGQERFNFTAAAPIRAVAVSPNNLMLVGACDDGTLRFWRAAAAPKVVMPE
jgi:WD40 repeat protein